ncbi:MAG TPA: hypothetical protein VGG39_12440 [Polyangiaceae bacterium]|jgi:hypothetical protein
MMTVQQQVGKLAEVVFRPPLGIDELSGFVAGVRSLVQRASEPLVFVCDWRAVDRFDQAMADTIVWTMRRDNPGVRANGVLVAARNTALYEQVAQVLHEARKPERRVFRARGELAAFLDPFLSADERRRRDRLLDEGQAATGAPRIATTSSPPVSTPSSGSSS